MKYATAQTRNANPLRAAQRLAGLFIVGAGLLVLLTSGWQALQSSPVAGQALAGGSIAALATALGALPVMFSQRLSARVQTSLLGFGAGVMLAASAFSLVLPGLEAAQATGLGRWGAGGLMAMAILLGGAVMLAMDRFLPHEHFFKGVDDVRNAQLLRRTWLFVFAIALHNLPEGLAIGVGYGGGDAISGSALATGISIQDVPEGLVVAVALLAAGYSRGKAVAIAAATGLVEPLGALMGVALVAGSAALLPWGLGFAAGAMLFVISHEIIPESHRDGHQAHATSGLMLGFVLMMLLDTALG
ncbi:ZIP family metal transporter [Variovorax dokdonensis]|uniref:ZIP family metal transporter n=1 Tax=Variovorax dokdonensis TaxID=344883 RepID=A0ABT7NCH8_9BURK|nr:ZIP family metal transporter [Variovorax dokdonensis]MDM0045660.1 ZIP family metal transporter [Variovorax dokdonensis]